MGGGSKKQIIGFRYYFSLLIGVCRGAIDELVHIKVGDLDAWTGSQISNGDIEIDKPELFGGDAKEGGIAGTLKVMLGDVAQVVSDSIKELIGGRVSDFRGVTMFWYDGQVSANNPYPKTWKFRVRRSTAGWYNDDPWYPAKAMVPLDGGNIHAMNPAHIVYECATNKSWGRGLDPTILDEDSFISAANTLCEEGFGLCLRWNRQDDLSAFVQHVLDHVGAALYIDRGTGLLTLRLIRDDYDPELLPTFDRGTGLLSVERDNSAAADLSANEIIIKYHDPILDEDRSLRAQNIASFQSIGSRTSVTKEYPGISTGELAARVAGRDLRAQSLGIKRFTVKLDRRAWKIPPGGVFKISDPARGIDSLVLRAGKVVDGTLTSGAITITALQDVFGFPLTAFVTTQPTTWTPPDQSAQPIELQRLDEANYRDLFQELTPADLALVPVASGPIATLAGRPTGLSIDYAIMSAPGLEALAETGRGDFSPYAILAAGIGHYDTVLTYSGPVDLELIDPGTIALIDDEFVEVVAIDTGTSEITITRGCVDTIPATHTLGAVIWFCDAYSSTDGREYVEGETVTAKYLTRTNTDKLNAALADALTVDIIARWNRPYPPGDLQINGVPYGTADIVVGDMVFTWTHRDRLLQQDQIIDHSEASIGPETNVTYTVRVLDATDDTVIHEETGITGDTWTYAVADFVIDGHVRDIVIEVLAVRLDGLLEVTSMETYRFVLRHFTDDVGYGMSYGMYYGGAAP